MQCLCEVDAIKQRDGEHRLYVKPIALLSQLHLRLASTNSETTPSF